MESQTTHTGINVRSNHKIGYRNGFWDSCRNTTHSPNGYYYTTINSICEKADKSEMDTSLVVPNSFTDIVQNCNGTLTLGSCPWS